MKKFFLCILMMLLSGRQQSFRWTDKGRSASYAHPTGDNVITPANLPGPGSPSAKEGYHSWQSKSSLYHLSIVICIILCITFALSNLIQNAFSRASFILLRCVSLTSRRENVRTGAELFSLITGGIVCSPSPSETSWHSSSRCAHWKNAIQRD